MRLSLLSVVCFALLFPAATFGQGAIQSAPAGKVVFYQDYQCTTGNFIALGKGDYADLRQYDTGGSGSATWNDQISCMVIGEGISKVTVFENINFKGKKKDFTRTANNPLGSWSLAKDWWNDKISSIKIQ